MVSLTASGEDHGAWFFYAEGSGLWFWTGTTKVYGDHVEAGIDLCGRMISGAQFDASIKCAQDAGNINTIQFTGRVDPEWTCTVMRQARNIEIVGVMGPNGDKLTGKGGCGNPSGKGVFRAGWEASQDCVCDPSKDRANCAISPGFPPNHGWR